MKVERKVVTITRKTAGAWGPHIVAQLERGEVVEVAGFRLALAEVTPAQVDFTGATSARPDSEELAEMLGLTG